MDANSNKYSLLQKASKTMFVAIAIASTISVFALVSIKSISTQISFNNQLIEAKEDVLDTVEKNSANLESLKSGFEALNAGDDLLENQEDRSNSAVILDALPIRADLPALNTFMANLATETGVELSFSSQEFASGDAFSPNPSPNEILFSLDVTGNYDSIKSFLNSVDRVIRPLKINDITLSGSDESLNLSISMNTYYQEAVLIEPTYTQLEGLQ